MNQNIPSNPLKFRSKKFENAFDKLFKKKTNTAKREGGIALTTPKGNKSAK